MSSFYNDILSSLRATEVVLVAVDVLDLPYGSLKTLANTDTSDNWYNRRVLAVVSHKDEWALTEEGALFVYKLRSSSNSAVFEPVLQNIYPIYGQFSIEMSQMRRNTLDPSTVEAKSVLDQPRSGFSLTITPAVGLAKNEEAPVLYSNDVQSLGVLVTESKRLKNVAEVESGEAVNVSQSTSHFSWLRPYISQPPYLSLLSSTPPDLRNARKPLFERLPATTAGSSGDDTADIQLIRDEWVRNEARSSVRLGTSQLSIRLGTFNVNGKLPSQDLSTWVQGANVSPSIVPSSTSPPSLPPVRPASPISAGDAQLSVTESSTTGSNTTLVVENGEQTAVSDPDILAFGFQELDLSTEALIYSTGTSREDAWCLAIFAALGEKAVLYEKLASKQLVGMLLVVIVKKSLKSYFGDIQTSSAGAGILGLMGNKGATAVRLTFTPPLGAEHMTAPDPEHSREDTPSDENISGSLTLTFVNAHLAAFDEMVDRRNQDYHEISRKLSFSRIPDDWSLTQYEDDFAPQELSPATTNIYETDVLFWMVDLNYRVDIPDEEFRQMLADKEWENRLQVLIRYDQLKKSISSGKAFTGFYEHPITHLPSYRFSIGVGMDQLGYDQKRRPAWTDRILHMWGSACTVDQQSYNSYPQITMSDHRPVAADFIVQFDLHKRMDYESAVKNLFREAQALDVSHERPIIKIDQSFIDFGEIKYNSRVAKQAVIENVGKIPCAWRFVPPPDAPIHPDWLLVEPMTGMLLPGGKARINLTVEMDKRITSSLNLGPRDMSGTLILHTLLGKDHFIAMSGEYLPSCFGNTLSTLTRLPGPIRSLTSPKELRGENHPLNAPGEVMRLVNRLMSSPRPPQDLFLQVPNEEMITIISECLDTGEEFPWPVGEGSTEANALHAIAHTLLRLLDSLIEPIVPSILHRRCVQMTSRDEAFELLDALQPAAVNVWVTVTAFLHFICQSSGVPDYPQKIADLFTPVLMRDDPDSTAPPISPVGKRKFFLHFVT